MSRTGPVCQCGAGQHVGLHPLDRSGFLETVVELLLGLILLYGLWRLGRVIRRDWRRPRRWNAVGATKNTMASMPLRRATE